MMNQSEINKANVKLAEHIIEYAEMFLKFQSVKTPELCDQMELKFTTIMNMSGSIIDPIHFDSFTNKLDIPILPGMFIMYCILLTSASNTIPLEGSENGFVGSNEQLDKAFQNTVREAFRVIAASEEKNESTGQDKPAQ
jgi:hypothetical protein